MFCGASSRFRESSLELERAPTLLCHVPSPSSRCVSPLTAQCMRGVAKGGASLQPGARRHPFRPRRRGGIKAEIGHFWGSQRSERRCLGEWCVCLLEQVVSHVLTYFFTDCFRLLVYHRRASCQQIRHSTACLPPPGLVPTNWLFDFDCLSTTAGPCANKFATRLLVFHRRASCQQVCNSISTSCLPPPGLVPTSLQFDFDFLSTSAGLCANLKPFH